jgi:hypothetical protein
MTFASTATTATLPPSENDSYGKMMSSNSNKGETNQ